MYNLNKQLAFTLIEVLIALMIFAIIGVMVSIGLRHVIDQNQRVEAADNRLQLLEVAETIVRQDVSNIIDRRVRNRDNHWLPSLSLKQNVIEFTRGGLSNPLNPMHQSDLERLSYSIQGNKLVRTVWPVLDRVLAMSPQQMTLLSGVSKLTISAYDAANQIQHTWPVTTGTSKFASKLPFYLPKAIQFSFVVTGQGQIDIIVNVPSRGYLTHAIRTEKTSNAS